MSMTERLLHPEAGLRNFQLVLHGVHSLAHFYTDGDPQNLTAGQRLTLLRNDVGMPRTVSLTYVAGAAAGARGPIDVDITGLDQFGNFQSERLSIATVASGNTVTAEGAKIFSRVDSATIVAAIANADAGDTFQLGLDLSAPAGVSWGLPWRVGNIKDFTGLYLVEGGTHSIRPTSDITLNLDGMSFKLAAGSAPDNGNDRLLFIYLRSSVGRITPS